MPSQEMSRMKFVAAALASVNGAVFAPVQLQKMFFLLDQNVTDQVGGPMFDFQPYDYGPFDKVVYRELEGLASQGMARINPAAWGRREYSLTPEGQSFGEKALESLPPEIRIYIAKVSEFVRSLGFAELVGAIYNAYPEMRENSIFQDG